jgi:hypothetical protein
MAFPPLPLAGESWMMGGAFIDIDTGPDPHPNPSPIGRGAQVRHATSLEQLFLLSEGEGLLLAVLAQGVANCTSPLGTAAPAPAHRPAIASNTAPIAAVILILAFNLLKPITASSPTLHIAERPHVPDVSVLRAVV